MKLADLRLQIASFEKQVYTIESVTLVDLGKKYAKKVKQVRRDSSKGAKARQQDELKGIMLAQVRAELKENDKIAKVGSPHPRRVRTLPLMYCRRRPSHLTTFFRDAAGEDDRGHQGAGRRG